MPLFNIWNNTGVNQSGCSRWGTGGSGLFVLHNNVYFAGLCGFQPCVYNGQAVRELSTLTTERCQLTGEAATPLLDLDAQPHFSCLLCTALIFIYRMHIAHWQNTTFMDFVNLLQTYIKMHNQLVLKVCRLNFLCKHSLNTSAVSFNIQSAGSTTPGRAESFWSNRIFPDFSL